ncbi:family 78 glycoside hydrolase catalytic domain [Arcticibacter eurypsychrophilus]|uniref:family 78 glycoside hydrolase catalytic domain n=1 Tax=Arcticibacter eurypsychrophilus TaxID=1434752 RepID=UPI00084D0DFC|nr:family 78 glycoside hydrolase catalytic domain [Arcticibacter eurypsychrophilus]
MYKNIIIVFLLLFAAQVSGKDLGTRNLRCEYKINPVGLDLKAPRLSWELSSSARNIEQQAYQVIVSDDLMKLEKNTGNIWDSRKVISSASIQVAYAGKALIATKVYYWKVKAWDNKGHVSEWSKPAQWQMGLLSTADWKNARWIAYEKMPDSLINPLVSDAKKDKTNDNNILPLLRKEFKVDKGIKNATLFISGLGHFDLSLNGKKVGENFLDPGWTKYDKQALYVSFDLTALLKQKDNALGVMLGNGFYYVPPVKKRFRKLKTSFGFPKMICRLAIEYQDGRTEDIISDSSWKTAVGPITFSSIYGGEDYNANLEQLGWDTKGFNDNSWKQVVLVDGPPVLSPQLADPLKVMQQFAPIKITSPKADTWVYDLGQNASGIPSIQVRGKKGDTVRITPAELINEDGTVNQKASGSPHYYDYVLKGDGVESWQPRFTYYGYRYLQITGGVPEGKENASHKPEVINLKGLHIRNSAARVGEFTSSNELFNKTDQLIDWAIKSNMMSVLTDCPHREKLGWLEESHLMGCSVMYNYDIVNLFRKIMGDIRYSQTPEGLVPEIAPEYVTFTWGGDMFRDSPEWGSSSIIVPWYAYQWYGDERILEENYPTMRRYLDYLKGKANNHILSQGLGDWFDIGPEKPGVSQLTPMGVTGTATYYYDLCIMSKIALKIGKPEDAKAYDQLAVAVKAAFNKKFFNQETKQYATGSQTANAMAVYMELVDPQDKAAVIANLIQDIRNRKNGLTAGDIGYRYVLRVLEKAGRSDVIFDMNSRSDVPGYGYQLAKGATALTESWQAYENVSNNHFMLGHLMEWFYSGLAGIQSADNGVAYKDIVICPEPVGDVTHASATYASPYGQIASKWTKTKGRFELNVLIPENTRATVYLPATAENTINESDKNIKSNADFKNIKFEDGKALINLGSGSYSFSVQ